MGLTDFFLPAPREPFMPKLDSCERLTEIFALTLARSLNSFMWFQHTYVLRIVRIGKSLLTLTILHFQFFAL